MVNYGELWWTWYTPKMEILAIPGCWLDVPEENELNRAVWFVSYGLKFHWDSNGKIGIEKYWDYIHIYIYTKFSKVLGLKASASWNRSQPSAKDPMGSQKRSGSQAPISWFGNIWEHLVGGSKYTKPQLWMSSWMLNTEKGDCRKARNLENM